MFSTTFYRDLFDEINTSSSEDSAAYDEDSDNILNNVSLPICKSTLEDLGCNEVKSIEQKSLPNENQRGTEIIEQIPSLERIKCTDMNYNTHTQRTNLLKSSSNQQINERSSLNNMYSENMRENYKKKHLVQKTPEIGERHCSYQDRAYKAATVRKNLGENMLNATQQIEQEAEIKEIITSGVTNVDTKMPEDVQSCQIAEANMLMHQQHFSANHSSSESHDHFQYSPDAEDKHTHPGITLSKSEVKNNESTSKSHLCPSTESLKNVSSPDEKSDSDEKYCSENRSSSSSFDDSNFKTEIPVTVELVHSNSNFDLFDSSINKPMLYSGEISKVPCAAINNAIANYFKLSKQHNESKPKPEKSIPVSVGVKRKQNDIKTMKTVAKYVSVSGMSPVVSSGIYSTAKLCDQKVLVLDSSSLRSTPQRLPPMKTAVGNNEVTKSITATQSSSFKLAPPKMLLPESSMTSLSLLSSIPELNVSNTSQSTTASTVNISAQESKNKGSINNPPNQKVLNEDISSHVFSADATASSSATENKLNPLLDSGTVLAENAKVRNKRKQQMVTAHSNNNDGNGIKCTEKPYDHDRKSSIVEIEQKYGKIAKVEQKNRKTAKVEQNSKKTAKASWNRTSNQQNYRTIKSKDSIFPDSSTNKLDILNKTTIPHLRIDHRMIDNLTPNHILTESKSKLTKSNIIERDLSEKPVCSASTSQEIICSPPQISDGSDKGQQEATFMPNEVNNVDSNLYPPVFNFPAIVNNHYLTKDTQRYPPQFGTTSNFDPRCFSAKQDHSRKFFSYSTGCDINAGKGFNYFAANTQALPLHGRFSTSMNGEKYETHNLCSNTVQQMVPTSQITNPLSNGDINMLLKDKRFDNYTTGMNTDNCNFVQNTYSNVPENENNWHNKSKEWEYLYQQLNQLTQNYDSNVNISLDKNQHNALWQTNNKRQNEIDPNIQNGVSDVNISSGKNNHNAHWQTNNNCQNEIGPNIQNWTISKEEDNLLNFARNFHDTLTEPHTSMEQVEAMQKHTQNNENKIIAPINKQEKINKQNFEKRKYTKRTKGANKTAVKFKYDEPYICDHCGKSEKYMAVLRRHLEVEHGWIMPPESADL